MSFSTLGLAPVLCKPLAGMGYTEPTPVQSAAIPLVLRGADVLARAQTGTGKTAAFALPMIERLLLRHRRSKVRGPRGLVLVPTRELAIQVHRALATYGASVQLRVTPIFGGVPMPTQVKALRLGTDIVVATPGRLIDHLQRRTVDLAAVEILTLDEADRMLDMGFLPSLRRVLPALPPSRQTLLFSATLSAAVVQLSGEFTRDALPVDVSHGDVVAPTITHRIHPVDLDRKRALLLHVLTQAPADQALVFCKTKRGADRVCEHLEKAGLRATAIHGDKNQAARTRSLAQFKSGHVSVLATDIAARGLDLAQLPLVVNYDLPLVAEDYVHRVGRTGRAGVAGRAVSLVTTSDRARLRDIQQLVPAPLEHVAVAGFETTDAVVTRPHLADRGRQTRQRVSGRRLAFASREQPSLRRLPSVP
jgi:ATP-dependent RNA helicase RhlE